jgi:HD-GYP domain-containing protein (c-di-GMP phosphodiesterase class II)
MRALNHARAEISRWSGSYFDPEVVEVFLKIPNEVGGCGCILRKEPAPKTQSGIRDAPNGVPGGLLAVFY